MKGLLLMLAVLLVVTSAGLCAVPSLFFWFFVKQILLDGYYELSYERLVFLYILQ